VGGTWWNRRHLHDASSPCCNKQLHAACHAQWLPFPSSLGPHHQVQQTHIEQIDESCFHGQLVKVHLHSIVAPPADHLLPLLASTACGAATCAVPSAGLTCAMYIQDGRSVPSPDPQAGLYICNRAGQVVQAVIPGGHIAFQLGQVLSIQSGGLLRATPHCVRAAAAGPPGISRNTFAVFMQPDVELELKPPEGLEALGGLLCMDSGHWNEGGLSRGNLLKAVKQ